MSNKRRITGARRKWREKQRLKRWRKHEDKRLALRLLDRGDLVDMADNPDTSPLDRALIYEVIRRIDNEDEEADLRDWFTVAGQITNGLKGD